MTTVPVNYNIECKPTFSAGNLFIVGVLTRDLLDLHHWKHNRSSYRIVAWHLLTTMSNQLHQVQPDAKGNTTPFYIYPYSIEAQGLP